MFVNHNVNNGYLFILVITHCLREVQKLKCRGSLAKIDKTLHALIAVLDFCLSLQYAQQWQQYYQNQNQWNQYYSQYGSYPGQGSQGSSSGSQ